MLVQLGNNSFVNQRQLKCIMHVQAIGLIPGQTPHIKSVKNKWLEDIFSRTLVCIYICFYY